MKRMADRLVWLAALGPALLLGPGLLLGNVLFWGTPMLQFVPWRSFALATLRAGFFPLWNPLVGMGAPLMANLQSAFLYPPNGLLLVVDPARGSTLLVLLHLAWAAVGMARLARRLDMNPLGQAVAGMAFGLSGYLVARAGFFSINAAAAWIPWIILAGDRLAADLPAATDLRARAAPVLRLAIVLALQWTAGHAQTAWYTLLLLLAWVAWRLLQGHGWRRTLAVLAGLGTAGALGFALAAPQLLPTLEYLRESYRAQSLDPAFAMTYSFWPWRFLGLLAPGLYGSPVSGNYWGYGNFWEDAIYVGVLPLLMGIVAAARGLRGRSPHSSLTRFLLGGMTLTVILALGDHTPFFPWLFRTIPTFDLFQAPTRWMVLFVFGLALLAGAGATAWRRVDGRALYWSRLGTAGAGAVTIVAWLAPRLLVIQAEPALIRALSIARGIGVAGVWLLLAGALVLIRRERPSALWSVAVALVTLADLGVAGFGLNPLAPDDIYRGRSALAAQLGMGHRAYMPADLEQHAKFEWAFRFDSFHALDDWRLVREAGLPNTLLLDGIPSAVNFDPLQPGRTQAWTQMLAGHPSPEALLALMDVGWMATEGPAGPNPIAYIPLEGARRVRVVPKATPVSSAEQALTRVRQPGFDPDAEVILETSDGVTLPPTGGTGAAELLPTPNPNQVTVLASTSGPAWLVLSDTWYPGWSAEVDGVSTPCLRADFLFRAVLLPAGDHTVVFTYRPASLRFGAWLAGATLLLLTCIWILGGRPKKTGRGAVPS